MIEVRDVNFSYLGVNALNNINIHIAKGESVALMGSNGSGKSTLLKLINGIIFSDKGTYRFKGIEITQKKLQDAKFSKSFHQKIGFVFQDSDSQLFCADVYDEIAFGPRQMGLDESEVEKRVDDCLKLLNIESIKHRQPYHLSGGEKKKLAIACVLSLNPEVLVLDEPMNGLDPRTQRWLVGFIADLNKSGKTIITATHNLELVQEISNRTILFNENHSIAADLTTEELLKNKKQLMKVNLLDEYYHEHNDNHHHFHMHNF